LRFKVEIYADENPTFLSLTGLRLRMGSYEDSLVSS